MIEIILALLVGIWIGKTVTNAWNQFTFMEILKDLKVSTEDLRKLREQQDGILDPEPRDEIEIKIEVKIKIKKLLYRKLLSLVILLKLQNKIVEKNIS